MADIDQFLEELSSSAPVPGGGSAAAMQAAMAASLLVMVANLTVGRKRYQDVEQEASDIRAQAEVLRDRAGALAEEDANAYRSVASAMALPKETEEQKAERRGRLQEALRLAVVPPLETMRVAIAILDLSVTMARIGNRSAISDVGVAALASRAAFHAARLNVEINVSSVVDEEWKRDIRRQLQRFESPDQIEAGVLRSVRDVIQG